MTESLRARDPTPGQNDFNATRIVTDAVSLFDIALHYQIFVGLAEWRNLREDSYL